MWHFVDDVKLFDGDLINFVEHIDAWDVDPVGTKYQCELSMELKQNNPFQQAEENSPINVCSYC